MQLYTATEQGLEQIHYDSRFTTYLITIGNCNRKLPRERLLSSDIFKALINKSFSSSRQVHRWGIKTYQLPFHPQNLKSIFSVGNLTIGRSLSFRRWQAWMSRTQIFIPISWITSQTFCSRTLSLPPPTHPFLSIGYLSNTDARSQRCFRPTYYLYF